MKFKDLPVGKPFEFQNHTAGSPHGPWIKTGTRTYYRPSDVHRQHDIAKTYNLRDAKFLPNKVGTVNVEVQEVTLTAEQQTEVEAAQPLMKGKFLSKRRAS